MDSGVARGRACRAKHDQNFLELIFFFRFNFTSKYVFLCGSYFRPHSR